MSLLPLVFMSAWVKNGDIYKVEKREERRRKKTTSKTRRENCKPKTKQYKYMYFTSSFRLILRLSVQWKTKWATQQTSNNIIFIHLHYIYKGFVEVSRQIKRHRLAFLINADWSSLIGCMLRRTTSKNLFINMHM